jgi:putative PEP-CTERM system TPR-repeat lipoprotein
LLLAVVAGCGGESAKDLATKAKQALASGDLNAAAIQYKNAVLAAPDDRNIRYELGQVYYRLNANADAEKEFSRAIELGLFDGGRIQVALAEALLRTGNVRQVLDRVNPLDTFEPEQRAFIAALRARAQIALGNNEAAKLAIDESLKLAPGNPKALLAQASLRANEGEAAASLMILNTALEKAPDDADLWLAKGDVLRASNRFDEALQVFEKAAALAPYSISPRVSRTVIFMAQNKMDAAQKEIDTVQKVAKNHPMAQYLQSLVYFRRGDFRKANDAILQALRIAPNYAPFILLGGATSYTLGSFQQAEKHLSQFLKFDPNNEYARKLLASTLIELNQNKRALEVIEPGLAKGVQDTTLLALAGNAHMHLGEFQAATQMFAKAASVKPDVAMLATATAVSRLGHGELERAIAELEHAAKIEIRNGKPDFILALTLIQYRRWDKALAALRALDAKSPNNPVVKNMIGATHLGKGDKVAARKAFDEALAIKKDFFPAIANLARIDLSENKFAAAKERFTAVLKHDPKDMQAMMALARFAQMEKKPKESADWLIKAANANPKLALPRVQLAAYYISQKDEKNALKYAAEAAAIAPNDADAVDLLGFSQMLNGDINSAIKTLRHGVDVAPRSAPIRYRLGTALFVARDRSAAETSWRAALQADPNFVPALESLALVELRRGKVAEAERHAKRLQKLAPKSTVGLELEATALTQQRRFPAAAALYERILAESPSEEVAMSLYMAQARAGNFARADAVLQKWVADHPKHIEARTLWADALMQMKRFKDAITEYNTLLQLDPRNAVALTNLPWAYHRSGDKRALEFAQKAHKDFPNNPQLTRNYASLLVETGDAANGMKVFGEALKRWPDDSVLRIEHAIATAKTGDVAGAKRTLEHLLANERSEQTKRRIQSALKALRA